MIFAAGLGTRLKPYTDHCPKAMVEVAGHPMIAHQLMKLREAGFSRVVINVHHYAEQIIDYVNANNGFGLDVVFSDERGQLLDTGGGIRKALPLFTPDSPVLIHNVDIFSNADLAALYENHVDDGSDASLLVSERTTSRYFIFDNEDLDALLEEQSLYWNDDKSIVDTFVLKTIKRFEESNGAAQELLPEYKDMNDKAFACTLFRTAVTKAEEYRALMSDNSKNWDMSRFAFMDVVIMQVALAEIFAFDDIPLNVTLNEYVEIAKYYSTAKSGSFVNGLLDSITKKLRAEGVINK